MFELDKQTISSLGWFGFFCQGGCFQKLLGSIDSDAM